MKLRSIIIDDEEAGIETLRLLIGKHLEEIKIVAECTRAKEAIEAIENYKPEIVFLDISMPEMDGFELLEKLQWKNFNLVFITAHQEYGLKALKNSAIDYLLKPIDYRDLRTAINKIIGRISEQVAPAQFADYSALNNITQYQTGKLGVTSKNGVEYIDPVEIVTLESQSNYTRIYLVDGRTITTPKTLGEFESSLCQENLNFMRVHHSYVINLRKVLRYIKDDEDIIMAGNQKIPLAKSRKGNFFRWLNP